MGQPGPGQVTTSVPWPPQQGPQTGSPLGPSGPGGHGGEFAGWWEERAQCLREPTRQLLPGAAERVMPKVPELLTLQGKETQVCAQEVETGKHHKAKETQGPRGSSPARGPQATAPRAHEWVVLKERQASECPHSSPSLRRKRRRCGHREGAEFALLYPQCRYVGYIVGFRTPSPPCG